VISFIIKAFKKTEFSLDDVPPMIESNYSSYLSNESQQHDRLNCYSLSSYYQALKISVNTSGYYMFSSDSSFQTDGYLFEHHFEPYNTEETLLTKHNIVCEDEQFRFVTYLKSGITYILVVTASLTEYDAEGSFSVMVKGPDESSMQHIGMYRIENQEKT
jgi:hypothetical protein